MLAQQHIREKVLISIHEIKLYNFINKKKSLKMHFEFECKKHFPIFPHVAQNTFQVGMFSIHF